jgi:hypothetical protein
MQNKAAKNKERKSGLELTLTDSVEQFAPMGGRGITSPQAIGLTSPMAMTSPISPMGMMSPENAVARGTHDSLQFLLSEKEQRRNYIDQLNEELNNAM